MLAALLGAIGQVGCLLEQSNNSFNIRGAQAVHSNCRPTTATLFSIVYSITRTVLSTQHRKKQSLPCLVVIEAGYCESNLACVTATQGSKVQCNGGGDRQTPLAAMPIHKQVTNHACNIP